METKEIIANNKLIAEFMGARNNHNSVIDLNSNEVWVPIHGICKFDTIDCGKGKTLEYRTSWDWLMRVVERIESLGFVTKIKTSPTISKKWTIHHMIVQKDSIKDIKYVEIESEYAENESKISLVYRGVIAFIKWYNENK